MTGRVGSAKAADFRTIGQRRGWEGTVQSAFQDRCLQPLGHPSVVAPRGAWPPTDGKSIGRACR